MDKARPKMLAVRAPRESCLAFYSKFKKFDIEFLAGTNSFYEPSVRNLPNNIKVINRSFYPNVFGKVNNLSLVHIAGLEELIRKTDIVNITDTYYSFNSQAVDLAKKYKKKVATIIWTTIPRHISSWLPPYSFFTKNIINNTDLFILRNKTAYKFTDSLGIKREKTRMIYKGVDLKHFYPQRESKNQKNINILYVGIYHPSKGLNELLEAFERLSKENLPVFLHLAGRGEMEPLINRKVASGLPINNHGFVPYSKLGDLYREADIFCSPSRQIWFMGIKIWEEYFSYTLMEAQASGLPIVVTKSGGIPEEVDSRNFLLEIGNKEQIYQALKALVLDKNLREKLSKINRERAEKYFNARIQARKTEDEILKLCY